MLPDDVSECPYCDRLMTQAGNGCVCPELKRFNYGELQQLEEKWDESYRHVSYHYGDPTESTTYLVLSLITQLMEAQGEIEELEEILEEERDGGIEFNESDH